MKYCAAQVKYLTAIQELSAESEEVKSVDIARHLGVSRSSVSKTLRCLANSGLVYEDFGISVMLTPEGVEAVKDIFRNFNETYIFFRRFLKLSHEEAHNQALTFVTTFPEETCDRMRKVIRKNVKKSNY
ncbi:MAG: metal-dependent transcriptional regulator [Ruminococcus sp.]|nr:metal-dependent transcriptional regulator [Ruminococcus sp.]